MGGPDRERLDRLVGEVRRLAEAAKTEIGPFRDLTSMLLTHTVLDRGQLSPRVYYARGSRQRGELGGVRNVLEPLRLSDGRWLRLAMSLFVEMTENGPRLKTSKSSFQYQATRDPNTPDWVFRYDYLRDPQGRWPAAHVQLNAELRPQGVLPEHKPLERVHFPTDRVPLEAVIRLLAEDFDVPCAEPPEVWRAMLGAAEEIFRPMAHRPPFGPAE